MKNSKSVVDGDRLILEYSPDTSELLQQTSTDPLESINCTLQESYEEKKDNSSADLRRVAQNNPVLGESDASNNCPAGVVNSIDPSKTGLCDRNNKQELLFGQAPGPLETLRPQDNIFASNVTGSYISVGLGNPVIQPSFDPNYTNVFELGYDPMMQSNVFPMITGIGQPNVFGHCGALNINQVQMQDDTFRMIQTTNHPPGVTLPFAYPTTIPYHQPEYTAEQLLQTRASCRLSEAEDWTPNPSRLNTIMVELEKLNEIINKLKDECDLPNPKPNSKREKNRLASKACRLKKKATHETNKIKLEGLELEFKMQVFCLNSMLTEVSKTTTNPPGVQLPSLASRMADIVKKYLSGPKVAGDTDNFVKAVLERVKDSDPTGGLAIVKKCMPKEGIYNDQGQVSSMQSLPSMTPMSTLPTISQRVGTTFSSFIGKNPPANGF